MVYFQLRHSVASRRPASRAVRQGVAAACARSVSERSCMTRRSRSATAASTRVKEKLRGLTEKRKLVADEATRLEQQLERA